MLGGGRLFGGGAFIKKTWQTPERLFGRGVYIREERLFEEPKPITAHIFRLILRDWELHQTEKFLISDCKSFTS